MFWSGPVAPRLPCKLAAFKLSRYHILGALYVPIVTLLTSPAGAGPAQTSFNLTYIIQKCWSRCGCGHHDGVLVGSDQIPTTQTRTAGSVLVSVIPQGWLESRSLRTVTARKPPRRPRPCGAQAGSSFAQDMCRDVVLKLAMA